MRARKKKNDATEQRFVSERCAGVPVGRVTRVVTDDVFFLVGGMTQGIPKRNKRLKRGKGNLSSRTQRRCTHAHTHKVCIYTYVCVCVYLGSKSGEWLWHIALPPLLPLARLTQYFPPVPVPLVTLAVPFGGEISTGVQHRRKEVYERCLLVCVRVLAVMPRGLWGCRREVVHPPCAALPVRASACAPHPDRPPPVVSNPNSRKQKAMPPTGEERRWLPPGATAHTHTVPSGARRRDTPPTPVPTPPCRARRGRGGAM